VGDVERHLALLLRGGLPLFGVQLRVERAAPHELRQHTARSERGVLVS
jgi:hypothetical protein